MTTAIPSEVTERTYPLDALTPHPRNYNAHPREQLEELIESLRAFGQVRDIVTWPHKGHTYILAGHGLWQAACLIPEECPTLRAKEVPETWDYAKALAYLAADNEHARNAAPDRVQLASILEEVRSSASARLEAMGWRSGRFAELMESITRERLERSGQADAGGELHQDGAEQEPEEDETPRRAAEDPGGGGDEYSAGPDMRQERVRVGDLWACGPHHRLYCGDARDASARSRLLDGRKPDFILTDPPYGMRLDTDWSSIVGSLKSLGAQHNTHGNKYAPVIGDDEDYGPTPLLELAEQGAREMFLFGADYYAERLPERTQGSWLVWDKRKPSQADAIGSEFELLWSMRRHKRRILRHDWFGFLSSSNPSEARNRLHPTQKPTSLLADLLEQWGKPGDAVVDLYGGSGGTLIAAHRMRRACYIMELSPAYCDVILRRFEAETGEEPRLISREGATGAQDTPQEAHDEPGHDTRETRQPRTVTRARKAGSGGKAAPRPHKSPPTGRATKPGGARHGTAALP